MEFTSNYTDDWRMLNDLTINWPWTQEEVYAELEKEDYTGDGDRGYCWDPKSPILKKLLEGVVSSIPKLLLEASQQEQFSRDYWWLDYKEQLVNNTHFSYSIVKDKPGFDINLHLDHRVTICTGMLFFNSYDDPDQATTFYSSMSMEHPIRMSSIYGKGWYSANTHHSWHTGSNNSNRDRYAIIFNSLLTLK